MKNEVKPSFARFAWKAIKTWSVGDLVTYYDLNLELAIQNKNNGLNDEEILKKHRLHIINKGLLDKSGFEGTAARHFMEVEKNPQTRDLYIRLINNGIPTPGQILDFLESAQNIFDKSKSIHPITLPETTTLDKKPNKFPTGFFSAAHIAVYLHFYFTENLKEWKTKYAESKNARLTFMRKNFDLDIGEAGSNDTMKDFDVKKDLEDARQKKFMLKKLQLIANYPDYFSQELVKDIKILIAKNSVGKS